ncbi:hypothetical protein AVO41_07525 [Thiomicrospira sp. WB1]|nr:hypothetical protein AVO41_07525 [Thiomicrospira sp. WB1]
MPIVSQLATIDQALASGHNLVLQAEPGAGKSTAVPAYLLDQAWLSGQKILMLEPRRLAVKTLASYLARRHEQSVGQTIGYQVRQEKRRSPETRLEIVTEGILTRRLQSDPALDGVGLVIFDEFHERSLHADLALALLLEVQSALRPDLRILVMSATLDLDPVRDWLAAYQHPVAACQAEGRCYPVATHYLEKSLSFKTDALPVLATLVQQALIDTDGDVLVFLPGQREIERLQSILSERLGDWPALQLRPLYGRLPASEQSAAMAACQPGERKVVLATNIAETSLTIEGVTAVVDSGQHRQVIYDPNTGMDHLVVRRISKASAEQRAGRAGRVQPGQCYRLWTQAEQARLQVADAPEIQRVDLTRLCLELAQWGLSNPEDLCWLTPPPAGHFAAAQANLKQLGLVEARGQITASGKQALAMPVSPRLAAMVLSAPASQKPLAASLAAFLMENLACQGSSPDALDFNANWRYWHTQKTALTQRWQRTTASIMGALNTRPSKSSDYSVHDEALSALLAKAYPDRVAKRVDRATATYQLAQGSRVGLPESSPLGNANWLVVIDVAGQSKRVRQAIAIEESRLRTTLSDQIATGARYHFDLDEKRVRAWQETKLGAVTLDQRPLAESDWCTDASQACLLEALQKHPRLLVWPDKAQAWLNRVRWLSHYLPGFEGFEEATLMQTLDTWLSPFLAGIKSVQALNRSDWVSYWQSRLDYEHLQTLANEAPAMFEPPAGRPIPIRYDPSGQAPPTVAVPLQALFGLHASPQLGGGQVPLRFELLSPARRPVQVTSNLAGFWHDSYHEVAKEMRGRYPKHRWPEDPLQAVPGRSIKR